MKNSNNGRHEVKSTSTINKGKTMKTLKRSRREVNARFAFKNLRSEVNAELPKSQIHEPADKGWYGVKSQDLSTTFFTEVDWNYCNAQFFGLDVNGDLTNNQYSIEKEETFSHAPAFLAKVASKELAKKQYQDIGEVSEEVALLFAEQLLEEQDKSYGFNKKSNSGEVTVTIQKSFLNQDGDLIWFNLTDADLGLGKTHKEGERRVPAQVTIFSADGESGIESMFTICGDKEVLNTDAVFKAVDPLIYITEHVCEHVKLGEGYRAVINHPEVYRLVGFAASSEEREVVEMEHSIFAVLPNNSYIADRNSHADKSLRESNKEIMYGRSADLITRHAEDVANAFAQRILEKAEDYNLEKIAKRAKIGAEVSNDKINAILAEYPGAKKALKTINAMYNQGHVSGCVTYVMALPADELQAVFNLARASKVEANRLVMVPGDFRSPYLLVKSNLKTAARKEVSLKKDFVEPLIVEIINLINENEEEAISVINKNKELAPQIAVAAQMGVRINNTAFYNAVAKLTTKEKIKEEREAFNARVA